MSGRRWSLRPGTLRGRITVLATAVTTVWVVVLTVGFNLVLAGQLQAQSASVLRTRAEAVASTVLVARDGTVSVRDVRSDGASDAATWILVGDRVLEAPTDGSPLPVAPALLTGGGEVLRTAGTVDPVRVLALPVASGGRTVATVVTAVPLAPYRQDEERAVVASVVLAVLLLAGVFAVLRAATGRALRPVQEMTEQAGRWSTDDVARRFGPARRPVELDQLAHTLDGVLDRLSAVLLHESTFTAELSHELRTPLSAIVGETALLRSRTRTPAEVDAAVEQVSAAATRMTAILDTLMATARTTTGAPPGRCSTRDVLGPLLGWTDGAPRGVLDAPVDATVGVDGRVLERMVSPVLDNARRYARSVVTVSVTSAPAGVCVRIDDDGPGFPAAQGARVFEPGWRGDPADGHDGAGLGLALVRRLVLASGGTVRAEPAGPDQTGGSVLLVLPSG